LSRSLLVITRHAPWSGLAAREALDLVLAGGAFDLPIGLLFLDDGVFQLLAGQQAPTLQQKDLCANLQALPLFGVEALFACARSLALRGLDETGLNLPVEVIDVEQIRCLIGRYDQVMTL
jgi:tRNA 2-thiouridine synthesizing protein C